MAAVVVPPGGKQLEEQAAGDGFPRRGELYYPPVIMASRKIPKLSSMKISIDREIYGMFNCHD